MATEIAERTRHEQARARLAALVESCNVDVSLSISPIRIASGRIIGASTLARDIGDRLRSQHKIKLARTQAEALAQLHADFVASVSHELRTPLTCIVGFTELLLSKWSELPDARRLDYIRRVAAAAQRQLRVVEELLVAGSLEADQLAEIYPVGWYGAHSRHMTS